MLKLKSVLLVSIIVAVSFLLISCGGGSSGGATDDGQNQGTQTDNGQSEGTYNGRYAGRWMGVFDTGELQFLIDSQGNVTVKSHGHIGFGSAPITPINPPEGDLDTLLENWATVDDQGVVTVIGLGSGETATVTVASGIVQGSWSAPNGDYCIINVNDGSSSQNSPPFSQITSPSEGTAINYGATIVLTGNGTDIEDGQLSGASLVWTSDLDGLIGTGGTCTSNTLSVGTHHITLTGTDSEGAIGVDTLETIVNSIGSNNAPPLAHISSPVNGATYTYGDVIQFSGSGSDTEDGTLSGASLVWTSNAAGQIGTGETFTSNNLSVGSHQITLKVTDSQGIAHTYTVAITVQAAAGTNAFAGTYNGRYEGNWMGIDDSGDIQIIIDSNGNVTVKSQGHIGFGSAPGVPINPPEGDLNTLIENWATVDDQGDITVIGLGVGETGTVTVASGIIQGSWNAPNGDHCTFTANDGTNTAPVAQINSPSEGGTYNVGYIIRFSGSGSDSEDGALTGSSLVWTSNVDGQIGTGESCSSSSLSSGAHQITLTAADSAGAVGVDTVEVLIPALPDTGQITSYTHTFGEDSDYTINPPYYTKLDAAGNTLADSATSWSMVSDDVTGLIWEVKTDDGGIHDKDNTYTWQNAKDIFIAQLNSDNFAGHADWRLPTVKELYLLVNSDKVSPAINTAYFQNTASSLYWSSTSHAYIPNQAWGVGFSGGYVNYVGKSLSFCVRAVRGGQSNTSLVDNGDGTISDTVTGLMWQQAEAGAMNWERALAYCENLDLAGHDDWRLPNRNELQSIFDYELFNPAIDTTVFPSSGVYWSSTTNTYNTDYAWVIYNDGDVNLALKSASGYYLRAVRGGQ